MEKTATQNLRSAFETLEMHNITKRFPGVLANDHVDFDVVSGEVHALLGENSADRKSVV